MTLIDSNFYTDRPTQIIIFLGMENDLAKSILKMKLITKVLIHITFFIYLHESIIHKLYNIFIPYYVGWS